MPDAERLKPGFALASSSWRSAASSSRDASSPPAFHGSDLSNVIGETLPSGKPHSVRPAAISSAMSISYVAVRQEVDSEVRRQCTSDCGRQDNRSGRSRRRTLQTPFDVIVPEHHSAEAGDVSSATASIGKRR